MLSDHVCFVPSDALWTPGDLSRFLGVPEKTLTDWRYRGIGPLHIKVGKHVRYRPVDVRGWVDSLSNAA